MPYVVRVQVGVLVRKGHAGSNYRRPVANGRVYPRVRYLSATPVRLTTRVQSGSNSQTSLPPTFDNCSLHKVATCNLQWLRDARGDCGNSPRRDPLDERRSLVAVVAPTLGKHDLAAQPRQHSGSATSLACHANTREAQPATAKTTDVEPRTKSQRPTHSRHVRTHSTAAADLQYRLVP